MHYSELPSQLDCVFPLSVAFSKIFFYWKLWGWVKKIKTEGFFPKHLTFSFPNVLYCSPESAISSWGLFNSWKHLQQCHHLTWFRLLLICYGLIKVDEVFYNINTLCIIISTLSFICLAFFFYPPNREQHWLFGYFSTHFAHSSLLTCTSQQEGWGFASPCSSLPTGSTKLSVSVSMNGMVCFSQCVALRRTGTSSSLSSRTAVWEKVRERERGGGLSSSWLASRPRTHHLLARPYNVLCHNYASSFILSKGLTSKVAKSLSLTQCTARMFGHTQQHSRKNKATVIVSPPFAFHYRLMAPLFSALLPLPLYFSLLYIFFLWMGQLDDDGRRDARRRPFWVEAPRRTAAPLSSETWHCPRRPISMLMRKYANAAAANWKIHTPCMQGWRSGG